MGERKAIEAALHRRFGMSPEDKAELSKIHAAQTDWKGQCRKCRAVLEGTLEQLKGHVCATG